MFMRPFYLRSQLEFSVSGEFDHSFLKRKCTTYTSYFKLLFVKIEWSHSFVGLEYDDERSMSGTPTASFSAAFSEASAASLSQTPTASFSASFSTSPSASFSQASTASFSQDPQSRLTPEVCVKVLINKQ
jgi:hypothetical protein